MKFYNTLSKSKDDFTPLDPQNVRLYVCGPTVYDYAHIGNARPVIVFDLLFRLLRHVYGQNHVTYVRNITDVDDKINARASQDYPDLAINDAIYKVTEKTIAQFHQDIAALGVLPPSIEPRCTGHIEQMIAMIETLIQKGVAYAKEDHVLLDVTAIKNYGQLSRRTVDEMIAGARVEIAPYKKNPADSVLWKPSPDNLPGWNSPWGHGRPGWHIECSAMAKQHLGEVFDIHGGGIDLQFPHHENELAQTTAAHDNDTMARFWMHNGFLQVEGQKMSKSLGNFITIHQLLESDDFGGRSWPGDVLRLAMLRTHYRQPIDWTVKGLEESLSALIKLYERCQGVAPGPVDERVIAALQDDLNTPQMLAALHQIDDAASLAGSLVFLGFNPDPESLRSAAPSVDIDEADIAQKIAERLSLIAAKNWPEADRIRDELQAIGVQLKDGKDATTGERTTTWEITR